MSYADEIDPMDPRSPQSGQVLRILERIQAAQSEAELGVAAAKSAPAANEGSPFEEEVFPLSSALAALEVEGYGVIYRREGSSPAGRLHLDFGGRLTDIYPGQVVRARFDRLTVVRSARSAQVGNARLAILKRPDVDLEESKSGVQGLLLDPVDLLGSSAAGTFVAMTEDTQPTGAAPAYAWQIDGWKRLRVIIDGQAANILTSCTLVPWVREPNSGLWLEQGTEAISVPDSLGTAYRYRVLSLGVSGNGLMALEVRNLLPAAATQVGFIVQGIE